MYSSYNEGKSVIVERFIRTLKNKLKHMKVVSKNVCFDVLDDIVNKYNNTVHRTIKMKPIDVTSDSYAEYNKDSSEKEPKFKVGDHARISKYKNIFAKAYMQNWSEEVLTNLASQKTEVDKLYIDKIAPVPVDLSKLSNFAKNDVIKSVYDKLDAKANNIDISTFVLKTKYQTDKQN